MALFLDSEGISVWHIQRLEPDKPPTQFILPDSIVVGPTRGQLLSEMTNALAMSANEAAVAKALQHLDPVHNEWEALFRAFEEIQVCMGGGITKWTSKAKKDKFTQTANHYRHGGDRNRLPAEPMDLYDARSFVRALVNRWIEEKSKKEKEESGSEKPIT